MGNEFQSTYVSLDEIRVRRESLSKEIHGEEREIKMLWEALFHRRSSDSSSSPSKRLNYILSTGAGVLDATILGWKLYRKFTNHSSSNKCKRW